MKIQYIPSQYFRWIHLFLTYCSDELLSLFLIHILIIRSHHILLLCDTMDLFASDTLAHEAYIRATLEAKSNYCLFFGLEQVGHPNDPDAWRSVDALMHIPGGGHIVPDLMGYYTMTKGNDPGINHDLSKLPP